METETAGGSVTACALLYGDHGPLHMKCLKSILETTPPSVELRIGLNQVCATTISWICWLLDDRKLRSLLQDDPRAMVTHVSGQDMLGRSIQVYSAGSRNIHKYPMMRAMLGRYATWCPQVYSDLLVWVDDDTWFEPDSDWYRRVASLPASTGYAGEVYEAPFLPGQWEFIKAQAWFKGVAPHVTRKGVHGFKFATGGFVVCRTDPLVELNWPPEALNHNGGDTLLGEALRQQGVQVTPFHTAEAGVHVDDAPRRGYEETPLGATVDVRR